MKENLEELEELLIVVDTVNGFIRKGILANPAAERIIPVIVRLIEKFNKKNQRIVFIKDCHKEGCTEFDRYPVHCLEGTFEAELVDELKPFEKMALVYNKNSTSAIFAPNFMEDMKKMKKLKKVIIVGLYTDICDINLAIPLKNFFDQINQKTDIIIPVDAVDTYDAPNHNHDEYTEAAFLLLKQAGITLVKTYGGRKYGK